MDQLGPSPDYHFMPVGNAGNTAAYWKGYTEYLTMGKIKNVPNVWVSAEGAAPIVRGHVIDNPETIATAIRISDPASWSPAEAARDESGGDIGMISDEDITKYQQLLAEKDGVFCEPACAVAIAGVVQKMATIDFQPNDTIVDYNRPRTEGSDHAISASCP